ncbi:hypothetical protein V8C44DRAFT_170224 [Trichoderma aethiopicum]
MLFQKADPNANANPVNKSREKVAEKNKKRGTGKKSKTPVTRCPICIVLVRFEISQTQIRGNCGILYGTDPVPLGVNTFFFFFFLAFFFSFRASCRLSVCACSMYVLRVNSCKSFLPAAECAKQTDYRRPSMVHESANAKYEGSVSEPDKRAIEISQT